MCAPWGMSMAMARQAWLALGWMASTLPSPAAVVFPPSANGRVLLICRMAGRWLTTCAPWAMSMATARQTWLALGWMACMWPSPAAVAMHYSGNGAINLIGPIADQVRITLQPGGCVVVNGIHAVAV